MAFQLWGSHRILVLILWNSGIHSTLYRNKQYKIKEGYTAHQGQPHLSTRQLRILNKESLSPFKSLHSFSVSSYTEVLPRLLNFSCMLQWQGWTDIPFLFSIPCRLPADKTKLSIDSFSKVSNSSCAKNSGVPLQFLSMVIKTLPSVSSLLEFYNQNIKLGHQSWWKNFCLWYIHEKYLIIIWPIKSVYYFTGAIYC